MSEFTRIIDLREIGEAPRKLAASAEECTALAMRFDLVSVDRLEAEIVLDSDGPAVTANGTLQAEIVQSCAVSGEDLPVAISEMVALRFVPAGTAQAEEIELDADQLDEIDFTGSAFDLGEALAQTLALAIDPFAIGPKAEEARRKAGIGGEGAGGAFAALAALKGKLD